MDRFRRALIAALITPVMSAVASVVRPCVVRMALVVVVLLAAVSVGIAASPTASARPADVCALDAMGACTPVTGAHDQTVRGWLLIKTRPQVGAEDVAAGGCGGCIWTVTQVCVLQSGVSGPGGAHCLGTFVGCTGTQLRFEVTLAAGAQPARLIDSYCYDTPDGGVVDAATVTPSLRLLATALTVHTPVLRAWPPGGVTLVNLPTFFAVQAPGAQRADIDGGGYRLGLRVDADGYEWKFGDGSVLATTDPGGAPPGGTVQHLFPVPGTDRSQVVVSYAASYTVLTPSGEIGPFAVAGGPVRTLPADLDLDVTQAYAGLTS